MDQVTSQGWKIEPHMEPLIVCKYIILHSDCSYTCTCIHIITYKYIIYMFKRCYISHKYFIHVHYQLNKQYPVYQ